MRAPVIIVVLPLVWSCSGSETKQPETQEVDKTVTVTQFDAGPSPGSPARVENIEYCPDTNFEWIRKPCFRDIRPDQKEVAKDFFTWFEKSYENWSSDLNTGFRPSLYLSSEPKAPDNIKYVDDTNGLVPGIEKLKTIIPEMAKRCPTITDGWYQAPLEVRWKDRNASGTAGNYEGIGTSLRENSSNVALPFAPIPDWGLYGAPVINIKGEFVRPANTPKGWYGYQYPVQLFREKTGGKTYQEGGRDPDYKALDEAFSHEYGHFLTNAWQINNGRSTIESYMFSEMVAEMVRMLCWGDVSDDRQWLNSVYGDRFQDTSRKPFEIDEQTYPTINRRFFDSNYVLYSMSSLIYWEKYHNRLIPDRMFRAIFSTMASMKGRVIKDYPALDRTSGEVLTKLLPWARSMDNPAVLQNPPVMFTRQEFLENFCNFYECGELKSLVEADAEGTRKTEW